MIRAAAARQPGRDLLLLAGMFLAAVVFWDWRVLYPLKVFVVLLHELGHGLAAMLSGGEIARIELSRDLGGVCWSRGGSRILVLASGYLGSMILGAAILIGAARSRHDRIIAGALGGLVILATLLFVRGAFGFWFGLGFGAALIAAGVLLPDAAADVLLKFLGLVSMLYAVIDIKEDLISRTVKGSDAYVMSRELFLPPVFWGVLWIVVAVAGTAAALWIASRPLPPERSGDDDGA